MIKQAMLQHDRIITISDYMGTESDVYVNGYFVGELGRETENIDTLMAVAHLAQGRPLIGYNFLKPYSYLSASDEDASLIVKYLDMREDLTESMELCIFNQDWVMLAELIREVDFNLELWYNIIIEKQKKNIFWKE